ncbi:MAG: hypothetical protein M3Y13_13600, partial [Armatimonadota bacterium]|nr:hypothetical protein [Armatimonadota bacterium]
YGVQAVNDTTPITSSMNFTTVGSTTDNKATILNTIPSNTVFYAYTHALPGVFADCSGGPSYDPNYQALHYVYSSDVSGVAGNNMGSTPPYSFVYFHACQAAGDNTLANAFGVNGPPDRAFLGFTTDVDDSQRSESFSTRIWQDLQSGRTVAFAISDAKARFPPQLNGRDNAAVPAYIGDMYTTVHNSVYGGTVGQWYK